MTKKRLVAIDDDPVFCALVKRALPEHEVRVFEEPLSALQAVRAAPPDLVITDLSMPGLNGVEVIEALREIHGTLPIIVYSGEGREEAILECFAAGANDYLVKPLVAGQLRAKVALLLSRGKAEEGPAGAFAGYKLAREVGRGGMGIVYEATSPEGARVALKILAPEVVRDQQRLARFLREAELLKAVQHPGIARFHAFGHEDLRYFIAMEFVDGPNLEEHVRGRVPLGEAEALDTVRQIAQALQALHEAGIVHRDVKPQNVLVAPGGVLKLADFGVAKRFDSAQLTAPNAYVGSPEYLAPEVLSGKPFDVRSDLYALGVTAYWLATGEMPFTGEGPIEVVFQHLHKTPPSPRSINARLRPEFGALITKLLAKRTPERFQTPAELLAVIARIDGVAR